MTEKMRLQMRNKSYRCDINRPSSRPKPKYEMCLSIMRCLIGIYSMQD